MGKFADNTRYAHKLDMLQQLEYEAEMEEDLEKAEYSEFLKRCHSVHISVNRIKRCYYDTQKAIEPIEQRISELDMKLYLHPVGSRPRYAKRPITSEDHEEWESELQKAKAELERVRRDISERYFKKYSVWRKR